MNNGYNFYFQDGSDVLTFPITPSELTIKVGSKNKVVNLINEGDINILKSPSLVEVEFEARFPMRKYPYSREVDSFQKYYDFFKSLKEDKKSFRFIVARTKPNGDRTWDTNLLMALEDFEFKESADEGDDVLVTFKLKQYKPYGVTIIQVKPIQTPSVTTTTTTTTTTPTTTTTQPTTTSTSTTPRDNGNKSSTSTTYIIKSGDTLWHIAKKFYGDGSLWKKIYDANKSIIESTAKKYGYSSSSNGNWIFPNTTLTIPAK